MFLGLWGGRGGEGGWAAPTSCRAGDDSGRALDTQRSSSIQLTILRLSVFVDSFNVVVVLKSSSGGGPVSGGGTLYMKWGAGSLRYRECVMRERVVKHTLTLIFSHTHNIFILSTYAHKFSQNKIIKKHPKKKPKYSEF
jgi:hypothetical protein